MPGTKLSQHARLGGPTGTKLSQHARLGGPTGTKLSQQAALAGPTGTKLSQRAPKRRFWPIFRMQGELFTASATNTTSTEKKSRTNTPLLASCLDRHTSPGQSTVYALYLVTFRREHQSTRGADIPMTVLQHGFVRRKIPITACAKVISGPTYHRRVSHRFESAYADRL